MGAEVEFPIGKKLFHLVLKPGTSRCPIVDLELVQTTRNVNGTRHSVRKFQPGKRAHLFRFSTFAGNFPFVFSRIMPTNSMHVNKTKFEQYCHMTFVGKTKHTSLRDLSAWNRTIILQDQLPLVNYGIFLPIPCHVTFNGTKTQSIWCSGSAVLIALEIMTRYFQHKFCEEEIAVLRTTA